jgi:hypothetical protein
MQTQLEVSSAEIEQLGDGSWFGKISARLRGRDLGPKSQIFRASNHVELFEQISAWFGEFLPPVETAPVKKGRKVNG